MEYKIIRNGKGKLGYFLISDNAYISDDTIIYAEVISKGYCEISTVGEINCYVDSTLEIERKDDSKIIAKIDGGIYERN